MKLREMKGNEMIILLFYCIHIGELIKTIVLFLRSTEIRRQIHIQSEQKRRAQIKDKSDKEP